MHGAVVERGEDVPVEDEEGVVGSVHEPEGAGGAEGLVFIQVIDADTEVAAVEEVVLDDVGLVARGDDDVADAGIAEVGDGAFE